MNEHDVVYFNNCKGRDHVAIYGPGAFFDLNVTGRQSKQAVNLHVGQECVVARYTAAMNKIVFDWYSLLRESDLPDKTNDNSLCRVFFGDLISSEAVVKSDAAESNRYQAFFNVNGHFKRPSVIHGYVEPHHRPRRKRKRETYCPEEVDPADGPFVEGSVRRITVNAFERHAGARHACLDYHGRACCICGFSFGATYGREADGYIHVHHLKALSEIKSSYIVDPKSDLLPVCPNCHAVLHLGGITRSIEQVKTMLKQQRPAK